MSAQSAFSAALLDPGFACPPGLAAWNGSDPAQRFAVYRNNVIVSLIDALADTFPVTQTLVGEDFFRPMARLFVHAHPPQSPVLANYGGAFPDFVERFPPAARVPYLAAVARLEMARVAAYHAADVPALSVTQLATILADEAALPTRCLTLHPSVGVLQSAYAIVSLWSAHQGLLAIEAVVPEVAQTALILRCGLDVEIYSIPPAAGRFIQQLQTGKPLGAAAGEDFDLAPILGLLIRKGVLSGVR